MGKLFRLATAILVILVLISFANAALITKSANITASENWYDGNTYYVSASISVTGAGVVLTIEPGAIVKFAAAGTLTVSTNARIVAEGTAAKRITLTSCKDNNFGADASAQSGCTGSIGPRYYSYAINVASASSMSSTDNFSYLNVFYATYGIYLAKDINSVHDCNFSFYNGAAATRAIELGTANNLPYIHKNTFNGTGDSFWGIYFAGSSNSSIYDNNFNFYVGSESVYVSGGAYSAALRIYDNNFYLENSRVYYSSIAPTNGQDINLYRNKINAANTTGGYAVFYVSGRQSGNIYDNNVIMSGNQAGMFYYNASSGTDVNVNFFRNQLDVSRGFNYIVYHTATEKFRGEFYDNNITGMHQNLILMGNTFFSCDINFYRNQLTLLGGYRSANNSYAGAYFNCGVNGDFHDNNIYVGYTNTAFRFASSSTANNIHFRDNNMIINDTNGGALYYTYGVHFLTAVTNAQIYRNQIDINGKNNTSYYSYGFYFGGDYNGSIKDNNFALKNYSYGLFNYSPTSFTGTITDNNFWMQKAHAYAATLGGVTYNFDMNRNFFGRISLPGEYMLNSAYYIIGLTAGATFVGNFCDNNIYGVFSPYLLFNGITTGKVCNNNISNLDSNTTVMYNFGADFNGNFTGNTVRDINIVSTSNSKYIFRISGRFDGNITNNLFSDINMKYGVTNNILVFTGISNYGKILDNNFVRIFQGNGADSFYLFSMQSLGTFSGEIARNNFIGSLSVPNSQWIFYWQMNFDGNINSNTVRDHNGTNGSYYNIFLRPYYTFNGNVFDNNIYNNYNLNVINQGGGIFGGNFFNNTIKDCNSPNSLILLYFGYPFSGKIYGNKFSKILSQRVFYIGNVSSGEFYNNLISDINYGSNIVGFAATTSTSIVNNTFNNIMAPSSIAINYGGATSSVVANNIFSNVLTAHGAVGNFTGTARNNAYYNVGTIGASAAMTLGDQNTLTGFTANPFVADETDRNFILNTAANGGAKLINAGYNLVSSYYNAKTTQTNNSLDRNMTDMGYHYTQTAPYAYVVSPDGGQNISGTQTLDFNIESGMGSALVNAKLYYSDTNTGGTLIRDANLSALTCSSGPIYACTYSWDASDVRDGNYYLVLVATVSNGQYTDGSASKFYVLSIPKVSLRTYLATKPRGYFASSQDVNLVVRTNSSIPLITITAPDGNILVNAQAMTDITGPSDLNIYQFIYSIATGDENYGWHDVRISGKSFDNVFYRAREWTDRFNDYNSTIFPFSMDLNVTEPNVRDRWFWPLDVNAAFAFGADINAVRVLEYSPTDAKYLEIPSQVHDGIYSDSDLVSSKVSVLVSIQKGETRQFYITYSKSASAAEYYSDSNFGLIDSNYIFENSLYKAVIVPLLGGLLSNAYNKLGSNNSLAGYNPMMLAPEAKAGLFTYSAAANDSPTISADINGWIYSKLSVVGNNGDMDYNAVYHFYAKQPYFTVDLNVKPTSAKTWTYLYDDYLAMNEGLFNKYAYFISGTSTISDINTAGTSSAVTSGDVNYWGSYKRSTGDGYGTIFLERSAPSYSVVNTFTDEADYEYSTRKIYAGSVTTSTLFRTKSAKAVFNAWNDLSDLNDLYVELTTPLTFVLGAEASGDLNNPAIHSYSYSPLDANDAVDLNFLINATDNIEVLYVDINAFGEGFSYYERKTFSDSNVSTSFLIPATTTNAGALDVNLIVTDIAANTTTQNVLLNLGDTTAPLVTAFISSIDSNADVDPLKSTVFDLNFKEHSAVASVKLLVRDYNRFDSNASWGTWAEYDFNLQEQNDYNYVYDYNYTFDANELVKQFKAQITDINGLVSDSNTITLYAEYDYTWALSSSSFSTVSAVLDTNATIEDFNITNTGDRNIAFSVSSDWDYSNKVFFNGSPGSSNYTFTLDAGEARVITTLVTAKSTERTDTLRITADATTSRASPDNNLISGTAISFAQGPFMYLEITDYPTTAVQGDTNKTFTLQITNKGNQDSNIIDINWEIPSNWTITFGAANSTISDLAINESSTTAITVTIGANATTGAQNVLVNVTPDSNITKLKSKNVTVTISAKTSGGNGNTGNTGNQGGGGGPGGGGGGASGGGGLPFSNTSQKDLFFQTSEYFEIVRGQDSSFEIKFTNPIDYNLVNLKLGVLGIAANYLLLKDTVINRLDVNEEFTTRIEIASPKYFTPGTYELTFTIEGGFLGNYGKETKFEEERQIKLIIHDTNKETAEFFIKEMEIFIADLKTKNYKLNEMPELYSDAKKMFTAKDFDGVKEKYLDAKIIFDSAIDAVSKNKNISGLVVMADSQGLSTPGTNRLIVLAQLAFQRGDYALAQARLKEAELTYALETKGEFNLFVWILGNLDRVALMIVLFILALFMFKKGFSLMMVNRGLKQYNEENKLLLDMIAGLQKRSFIENKISLSEYYDALTQFENRIALVSEGIIELTSKRTNLLSFTSKTTRLNHEKKSLMALVKEMQYQYFNRGLVETRIYQTRMNSLVKRLSEVDEAIVESDLKKTVRINSRGIKKLFWKAFYFVFK